MPSALLASAQKELSGQSRDLTRLVRQVKDILPQYSDDNICEALIQCDEDIDRSVELLLNTPLMARAGKKKKERKERQADAEVAPGRGSGEAPAAGNEGWGDWGDEAGGGRGVADAKEALPEVVDEVPRDDRPKTECEKHAGKLRKKLREIERIEERLAKGDNVDPLQLPKIQKKAEVEQELQAAEQAVREEERQREEERLVQEAEEKRQREEEERQERERRRLEVQRREEERLQALRDEQAAREQRDREARHRSAQEAADAEASRKYGVPCKAPPPPPPTLQAQGSQRPSKPGEPKQAMGAQLLSMLHKGEGAQNNKYEQSRQTAAQLSGGRHAVLTGHGGKGGRGGGHANSHTSNGARNEGDREGNDSSGGGSGGASAVSKPIKGRDLRQESWAQQEDDEEDLRGLRSDEFTSKYSTPLDKDQITPEQRAEAERIANEIEGKDQQHRSGDDQYRRGGDDRRGGKDKDRSGKGKGGKRSKGDHDRERKGDHDRERKGDHDRERKGDHDRERKGDHDRERKGDHDRERKGDHDRERKGEARGKGGGRGGKAPREGPPSEANQEGSPQKGGADKGRGRGVRQPPPPPRETQTRMESDRLNW